MKRAVRRCTISWAKDTDLEDKASELHDELDDTPFYDSMEVSESKGMMLLVIAGRNMNTAYRFYQIKVEESDKWHTKLLMTV